jgi:hypothetical protein
MIASKEETAGALAELPRKPATRRLHFGPYRAGKAWLVAADDSGGADDGDHFYMRTRFFRDTLSADTIAELIDGLARDRPHGEARELDISPWGGAYSRVPAGATAFPHRAERLLIKHSVAFAPPASPSDWLARSWAALAEWARAARTRTSPTPSWPISARPTTAQTSRGCERSRRTTTGRGLLVPAVRRARLRPPTGRHRPAAGAGTRSRRRGQANKAFYRCSASQLCRVVASASGASIWIRCPAPRTSRNRALGIASTRS